MYFTLPPSPAAVWPSSDLPVYISIWYMYPTVESDRTQTLKPLFIGFSGIYCFIDDLPLNITIASSMLCDVLEAHCCINSVFTFSTIGRILYSLLKYLSPCFGVFELSLMCSAWRIFSYLFTGIMSAIGCTLNSISLLQNISVAGSSCKPIPVSMAIKALSSSIVTSCQCRIFFCLAYRFVCSMIHSYVCVSKNFAKKINWSIQWWKWLLRNNINGIKINCYLTW